MNKVILTGRLVADPEVREGTSNKVAKYRLAVDRRFRKEEQTADFISCVAFGKSAEFAEKYLRKGIKIGVAGRIQTGSYTKSDGTKVYTTDVVVDEQEFLESKGDTGKAEPEQKIPTGEFMDIPDDDLEELPFA